LLEASNQIARYMISDSYNCDGKCYDHQPQC